VDGTPETCPTKIRLQAPRRGAPDMNVTLTCNGPGQPWKGVEEALGGYFYYSLLPERKGPYLVATGKLLEATIDYTKYVTLSMELPQLLLGLGKENRKAQMALQGEGKPPACMCTVVRQELESAKRMRALYLDKDIMAVAKEERLRGSMLGENFWMDDQRKLQPFNGRASKDISYMDLVSGINKDEISVVNGKIEEKKGFQSEADEKAQDYSFDQKNEGALASTHPNSCKITPPTPSLVQQLCLSPTIVYAANRHEEQHVKKCESFNSPPTYITPDGDRFDWRKGGFAAQFKRKSLPQSGYSAWLQKIENQAKNEADGYAVDVEMLSNYLSTYCN